MLLSWHDHTGVKNSAVHGASLSASPMPLEDQRALRASASSAAGSSSSWS